MSELSDLPEDIQRLILQTYLQNAPLCEQIPHYLDGWHKKLDIPFPNINWSHENCQFRYLSQNVSCYSTSVCKIFLTKYETAEVMFLFYRDDIAPLADCLRMFKEPLSTQNNALKDAVSKCAYMFQEHFSPTHTKRHKANSIYEYQVQFGPSLELAGTHQTTDGRKDYSATVHLDVEIIKDVFVHVKIPEPFEECNWRYADTLLQSRDVTLSSPVADLPRRTGYWMTRKKAYHILQSLPNYLF